MKYLVPIIMTIIMTACQAEKLMNDLGVHMEMEIDKPSDLPPSPPSMADKEIKELIKPEVEVKEVKKGG